MPKTSDVSQSWVDSPSVHTPILPVQVVAQSHMEEEAAVLTYQGVNRQDNNPAE